MRISFLDLLTRLIEESWVFLRETERDWDKELAEDVKGECEGKYGKVEFIKVEKESQVDDIVIADPHLSNVILSLGRDLREVRFSRLRQEGCRRFERPLVRRQASLSRFHFGCHNASSSVIPFGPRRLDIICS